MVESTILTIIHTKDNSKHTILLRKQNTINDLKFILSKRFCTTPNYISLYTSEKMNDLYDSDEYILNKTTFYMFIDYYEEPPRPYSFFRYYFCCGR